MLSAVRTVQRSRRAHPHPYRRKAVCMQGRRMLSTVRTSRLYRGSRPPPYGRTSLCMQGGRMLGALCVSLLSQGPRTHTHRARHGVRDKSTRVLTGAGHSILAKAAAKRAYGKGYLHDWKHRDNTRYLKRSLTLVRTARQPWTPEFPAELREACRRRLPRYTSTHTRGQPCAWTLYLPMVSPPEGLQERP